MVIGAVGMVTVGVGGGTLAEGVPVTIGGALNIATGGSEAEF